MVTKRNIVTDVDRVMSHFFATATDDEFWAELEDAGWAEFSQIDAPVIDYHRNAVRYRVTALIMAAPESAVAFAMTRTDADSSCTAAVVDVSSHISGTILAANSNELALAA